MLAKNTNYMQVTFNVVQFEVVHSRFELLSEEGIRITAMQLSTHKVALTHAQKKHRLYFQGQSQADMSIQGPQCLGMQVKIGFSAPQQTPYRKVSLLNVPT